MTALDLDPIAAPELVVVSNRLPVDVTVGTDGALGWTRSPGGLVTALEPVMRGAGGAWVGWSGMAGTTPEPFELDGMRLVPVGLDFDDFERYYEGFSNDTLWPLYHDVIAAPTYHRDWWDAYQRVNRRFAEAVAGVAAPSGTVWVHDYHLQLVPRMLRAMRPDLAIGYFHHVPFPPYGLFSQLPWRAQVIDGLLGADVVGFQRTSDAANFATAVRRLTEAPTRAIPRGVEVEVAEPGRGRTVVVRSFPISIDAAEVERLARSEAVQRRAREIRETQGERSTIILGADRLDYTKGIGHRIKAYGELLEDGVLSVEDTALIQVASPSREGVAAYANLRDEVELAVGRINGSFSTLNRGAVSYHHRNFPREEMVALYLAADVLLVTALRDGMNLVAKEYVASRFDDDGVLVLSEFAGAADELRRAVLVNPHDIDGLKRAIVRAVRMPRQERRSRMRSLRRRVAEYDVDRWAHDFLGTLRQTAGRNGAGNYRTTTQPIRTVPDAEALAETPAAADPESAPPQPALPEPFLDALRELARRRTLLVALDFDGTISPEVDDPPSARALPEAREALLRIAELPGTRVAVVSGRPLAELEAVSELPGHVLLVGSHGAEIRYDEGMLPAPLDPAEQAELARIGLILESVAAAHENVWLERKPVGFALHTRLASEEESRLARWAATTAVGDATDVLVREGRTTLEFAVRGATKGEAIDQLRRYTGADAVFYAGDDATDEDAFAALDGDDVGLKVGSGSTVAQFRVPGPAQVAIAIARLAELRGVDAREPERHADR